MVWIDDFLQPLIFIALQQEPLAVPQTAVNCKQGSKTGEFIYASPAGVKSVLNPINLNKKKKKHQKKNLLGEGSAKHPGNWETIKQRNGGATKKRKKNPLKIAENVEMVCTLPSSGLCVKVWKSATGEHRNSTNPKKEKKEHTKLRKQDESECFNWTQVLWVVLTVASVWLVNKPLFKNQLAPTSWL